MHRACRTRFHLRFRPGAAHSACEPGRLVVIDEIHRAPGLFQVLRGVIDRARRQGRRAGLFLLLGSASIELMRQSESLAGRIAYVEMTPVTATEVDGSRDSLDRLWARGGFPDSLLAADDAASAAWREDFLRTYLERDVPQFGPRIPSETLRRLWTMLAHHQGQLLNASRLAAGLAVSSPTVARYIDLLVDLLLVRRLPPVHANTGKRLVKSPKVYVRDSGVLHALLGLRSLDELLGHPVAGPSWEGFVIETLLAACPGVQAGFYRTAAGAEVDLVLEFGGRRGCWAVEVKRGLAPTASRGLREGIADLAPAESFIVHAGADTWPLGPGLSAISLGEMARRLAVAAASGVVTPCGSRRPGSLPGRRCAAPPAVRDSARTPRRRFRRCGRSTRSSRRRCGGIPSRIRPTRRTGSAKRMARAARGSRRVRISAARSWP